MEHAETAADHYVVRGGERYAGHHVLIDLWDARGLSDAAHIERALRAASAAANATVLDVHLHRFDAQGGVSGVAILAESHMSIHTWPETGFAAVDVFLCGDTEPDRAVRTIVEAFAPGRVSIGEHKRGALRP